MPELTKAANHPNLTHSRRHLVCGNVYFGQSQNPPGFRAHKLYWNVILWVVGVAGKQMSTEFVFLISGLDIYYFKDEMGKRQNTQAAGTSHDYIAGYHNRPTKCMLR